MTGGFVLDSGALIALERPASKGRLLALLQAHGERGPVVVSAGSLAEVWRGSSRQAALSHLLRRQATEVAEITVPVAKSIGAFLARRPAADDIVDAHVVMLARQHGFSVITSDPGDLRALDPQLALTPI